MSDFTLESPDGQRVVTGSPGERARLVAQGYRDVADEPDTSEPDGETSLDPAEKADTAPATASRKADAKTEIRNR